MGLTGNEIRKFQEQYERIQNSGTAAICGSDESEYFDFHNEKFEQYLLTKLMESPEFAESPLANAREVWTWIEFGWEHFGTKEDQVLIKKYFQVTEEQSQKWDEEFDETMGE